MACLEIKEEEEEVLKDWI